jgi:hypothetical protein
MRLIAALAAALTVTGCATSGASLGQRKIVRQFTSSKAPNQLAGCIALALNGNNSFVSEGETHFVVLRNNGYGLPAVRYDIIGTPAGSRVELRRAISINSGTDKVEACL